MTKRLRETEKSTQIKESEERRRTAPLHTTVMPPEFSRLHIPSSGAIPIVVPLKMTPLHRQKENIELSSLPVCQVSAVDAQ